MTHDDEILFDAFEEKLRMLMDAHGRLKAENLELRSRLHNVEGALQAEQQRYAELNSSYLSLKDGRVLEGINVEDVSSTRARLTRLVREVNRCIAMLNADTAFEIENE
ncbi:MAG: hypothetical protein J5698_01080 [Bacteroidaceae bacterium]|nr:hypothetical protein [Bacteroidaceae bacterium]MBO4589551.1 hypothetical protein [Bacteroidaceae bacterium]